MGGSDLCILMPTYEKYRRLADLTTRVLDREWADHPTIFYCGVPGRREEQWLALRADPADWMGFVRDAVRQIRQKGYRKCYVICEEHLPLFRCHEAHLNRTLPELMAKLDAVRIGLHGWGQGQSETRVVTGRLLGAEHFWIENMSPGFPWKFELHPALWRLDALENILDTLVGELPLELRSPWAFERRAGREDARLPEELKRKAYRICGERMAACRSRTYLLRLERFGARVVRFAAGRLFGEGAWTRIDRLVNFLFGYYEGPYPFFFSGVMVKTRLNRELIRFLRLHWRRQLAKEIVETVAAMESELTPGSE